MKRPTYNRALAMLAAGVPVRDVAAATAYSDKAIYRMARENGLAIPKNRRGPVPLTEVEPISPLHRKVGVRLCGWRQRHPIAFDSYEDTAEVLNLPPGVIQRCELGGADLKLSELMRIAAAMGTTVGELVG